MNDLLQAPNMTMDQPFALADSGPNSKLQLRASVRVINVCRVLQYTDWV